MAEVSKILSQTVKIHNKTTTGVVTLKTTTGVVTLVGSITVAPTAEVPTVVAAAREVQTL